MTDREQIERAVAEFYAYEDELIPSRRAAPGDDLISALIGAEEAGDRLSDNELRNLILNILVGGVDTSQSQLAHAVRLLAEHPDQWQALRADPQGLALAAVDEAIRYEPITPFTARILTSELEYRGVTFPAGSSSRSRPRARARACLRSARGSTIAWGRTLPAWRCRRDWRSWPSGCRRSSSTGSPNSGRRQASTGSSGCPWC
jgi:hypothetical protein